MVFHNLCHVLGTSEAYVASSGNDGEQESGDALAAQACGKSCMHASMDKIPTIAIIETQ